METENTGSMCFKLNSTVKTATKAVFLPTKKNTVSRGFQTAKGKRGLGKREKNL